MDTGPPKATTDDRKLRPSTQKKTEQALEKCPHGARGTLSAKFASKPPIYIQNGSHKRSRRLGGNNGINKENVDPCCADAAGRDGGDALELALPRGNLFLPDDDLNTNDQETPLISGED